MKPPQTPSRVGLGLLIALLLLGAALRFGNLGAKPFWFNEVFTALHTAGFDEHAEVNPQLYDRGEITSADFQHFQRPPPDKRALDTVRALTRKEPNSPPIYFLLARLGFHLTGDTVIATRGVSALCSFLALFALYWLGVELFNDRLAAGVAVALMAISPFFVRYAQEGRPYSIWLLTLLLASAALLRAMRLNTTCSWTFYAATVVLTLYTHLLTVFVLAAHGAYVTALALGWREGRVGRYLLASLAAGLAFLPWVVVIYRGAPLSMAIAAYLNRPTEAAVLIEGWCLNLDRLFFAWSGLEGAALASLTIPILLLVGVALFSLCRSTPPRVRIFVVMLVGIPLLAFLVPDLIRGGRRSLQDRYLLPTFLGLELAVAGTLAAQSGRAAGLGAWAWRGVMVALVLVGAVSSLAAVRADTWWGLSEVDLDLVEVFNESPSPCVISDAPFGVIAPLSYRLHSDVHFLLTKHPETLVLPQGRQPVYIYQPSPRLRERIEQELGMGLRLVYRKPREDRTPYYLYRLTARD